MQSAGYSFSAVEGALLFIYFVKSTKNSETFIYGDILILVLTLKFCFLNLELTSASAS